MRLSGTEEHSNKLLPTRDDNNEHVARRRISWMFRANKRDPKQVHNGDEVYFWRDDVEWVGPALVIKVESHVVGVWHNGSVKSASTNRVRRLSNFSNTEHGTTPAEFDVTASQVAAPAKGERDRCDILRSILDDENDPSESPLITPIGPKTTNLEKASSPPIEQYAP